MQLRSKEIKNDQQKTLKTLTTSEKKISETVARPDLKRRERANKHSDEKAQSSEAKMSEKKSSPKESFCINTIERCKTENKLNTKQETKELCGGAETVKLHKKIASQNEHLYENVVTGKIA